MKGSNTAASGAGRPSRLGNLAHFTARYRWPVIALWIVLTLVGGVAAGKLSSRWYQSTAIPGKSAYEAGQPIERSSNGPWRRITLRRRHSSRADHAEISIDHTHPVGA